MCLKAERERKKSKHRNCVCLLTFLSPLSSIVCKFLICSSVGKYVVIAIHALLKSSSASLRQQLNISSINEMLLVLSAYIAASNLDKTTHSPSIFDLIFRIFGNFLLFTDCNSAHTLFNQSIPSFTHIDLKVAITVLYKINIISFVESALSQS